MHYLEYELKNEFKFFKKTLSFQYQVTKTSKVIQVFLLFENVQLIINHFYALHELHTGSYASK
jgi:hypothetical protein